MNNSTIVSREARIISSIPDGLAAFAHMAERCIAWLKRRRQLRRDVEILSGLDDQVLADIGFSRDQIERAAWHGRLPERCFSEQGDREVIALAPAVTTVLLLPR